jgi:predicted RNA binding protein YcfA (HicA-like mRNA interferase family)
MPSPGGNTTRPDRRRRQGRSSSAADPGQPGRPKRWLAACGRSTLTRVGPDGLEDTHSGVPPSAQRHPPSSGASARSPADRGQAAESAPGPADALLVGEVPPAGRLEVAALNSGAHRSRAMDRSRHQPARPLWMVRHADPVSSVGSGHRTSRGDAASGEVREAIRLIEEDGWVLSRTRGSHRQYKHPSKPGLVTIPGSPARTCPSGCSGASSDKLVFLEINAGQTEPCHARH